MNKRVVFLSQLFDPEYSIKGLELCKFLSRSGYNVEVVTTFPSYPKGRLFEGFSSRIKLSELRDGVKVTRLWSFITPRKGKAARALNYLSFFVTSFFYLLFSKRADVIYAYHPQITMGVTASLIRLIRKTPFVTDIQDLWPESLIAEGASPTSIYARMIDRMVNFSLKHATRIVVLSKGFRDYLTSKGIPESKVDVIYNWCPEEKRYLSDERSVPNDDVAQPKTFLYTGNHGPLQRLSMVIEAFARFNPETARLILIGQGAEKESLVRLRDKLGAENIVFQDFVAPSELVGYVDDADAMVCHLKNDPLFEITIPSKVQAYLCSGKAILIATGSEARDLVSKAGAGVTAQPENVDSIANAIELLCGKNKAELAEMGANGATFYRQELQMERGFRKVAGVIESCL
tara:strand:- start:162 stop:1370 length:1209 start_codon:yes stop_codon:yes gene_type:complete